MKITKITKKQLYVALPVAVAVIVILIFLIFGGGKDYTQVIPSDASVVVSVDIPYIMKTSGLANKTPDELKSMADKIYNPALKALVQDPAATGLSLKDKAYLFASVNKDEPTLVFKVADKGKLEKTFKQLITDGMCDDIEDHGSYEWTLFHGVGYCAFNKRVLMIVTAADIAPDNVMVRVRDLMKQGKGDCILSNPAFEHLEKTSAEMNMYLSLDAFPQVSTMSMMMGVPGNVSLRNMRLLAHVNFMSGRVVTDGEYFTTDKDLQKYFDGESTKTKAINKTFLNRIPQTVMAAMTVNMTGDKIYQLLLGSSTFKGEMNKFKNNPKFKAADFFNSINGDVAMAFTGFNQYSDPKLDIYISMPQAKLDEAFKNLTSQMQTAGLSMRPSSAQGEYVFDNKQMKLTVYATQGEGFLYLTNDDQTQHPATAAVQSPLFASTLEGMQRRPTGYIVINPQSILGDSYFQTLLRGIGNIGKSITKTLGACSAVEAYNTGNNKFRLNIYMKNKQDNILKNILDK